MGVNDCFQLYLNQTLQFWRSRVKREFNKFKAPLLE